MSQQRTLSSTQIRYLRIGPKVNQSNILKQQLINALQQQKRQQGAQFSMGIGNLNKIPKFSYGQMSKTVTNFGVLINQNFGSQSTLHQMQKFGKLAKQVDKIMQVQKDKLLQSTTKKNSANGVIDNNTDKRTVLKSIYNYQGQKIFVVLNSFSIQAVGQSYKQVLPFSLMKLLITHVNSSKLIRIIQSSYQMQGEQLSLNIQKIQQKCSSLSNNQQKYHIPNNKFEKFGYEFKINLPFIQFSHLQSQFKYISIVKNKDMIDILEQQFDNVHDIVYKYFDHEGFTKILQSNHSFSQNNSHFNDDSPHKEISDIKQNQMQEQQERQEDQQQVERDDGNQGEGQQQQQQGQGQGQQGQQQQQQQQQQGQPQQQQQGQQQQQQQGEQSNQQQQNQSQITPQ